MKFRKLIVLTLMACLMLTGCINTKVTVNIDENNGGTVTMRVLMEESVHAMVFSEGGMSSGLEEFTEGEPFIGDDGNTYIPFTKEDTYATYEEMAEGLMSIDALTGDMDMGFEVDMLDGEFEENPDIDIEAVESTESTDTIETDEATITSEDATTPSNEDEAENTEEEVRKLFSNVEINKIDTATGYIYTFSAVLQKQGDDQPIENLPEVSPEPDATDEEVDATDATDTDADTDATDTEANDEGPVDLGDSPMFGALAASINDMFKVELEIVLPVDIQDYEGGMVQGNTLICDIRDLTEDTSIFASGEFVLEPLVEPQDDEFYLPEPTTNSTASGIMTYFLYVGISMAIIGTATAVILGVMKLTKRK